LWEAIAQSGQDNSIARRPVRPLDLPLQDLNLTPERQHFSLELGLIAVARGEHVEQDPNQRIDERSHHAGAKS
jgi:hypothetical protein